MTGMLQCNKQMLTYPARIWERTDAVQHVSFLEPGFSKALGWACATKLILTVLRAFDPAWYSNVPALTRTAPIFFKHGGRQRV